MIAVIGGGISGLSVAWELQKRSEPYILLERKPKTGGVIKTVRDKGFLLEGGPTTIYADDDINNFLHETGADKKAVNASEEVKKKYIFKGGGLREVPSGPAGLLATDLLSLNAKIKILTEFFRKGIPEENETLDHLITRRFSKEVSEYLLAPMVNGIFAGDTKKLLVGSTFPFLAEYEKKYGSILKGFIKSKKKKKKSSSLYFTDGMHSLISSIERKLYGVKKNAHISRISKESDRFAINYNVNGQNAKVYADSVVIATPSYVAGDILKELYPEYNQPLKKINYPSLVKVFLGYKKEDINISGYGALYPPCEKGFLTGLQFNSSSFPNSSGEDNFLITAITGGAVFPEHGELSRQEILEKTKESLKQAGIKASPVYEKVIKIKHSIPQYDEAIKEISRMKESLKKENIHLSGNWTGNPSVSGCIKRGLKLGSTLTESAA